jgi:hypothetical protein
VAAYYVKSVKGTFFKIKSFFMNIEYAATYCYNGVHILGVSDTVVD